MEQILLTVILVEKTNKPTQTDFSAMPIFVQGFKQYCYSLGGECVLKS